MALDLPDQRVGRRPRLALAWPFLPHKTGEDANARLDPGGVALLTQSLGLGIAVIGLLALWWTISWALAPSLLLIGFGTGLVFVPIFDFILEGATTEENDLVVAASPKGDLRLLCGPRVLLPHGAGFDKSIPGEGSADSASGLDPAYLRLNDHDDAPTALHALAHPDQVARLAATDPRAARHAKVIGDLTLERVLASTSLRDRYRAALGTGARTLIVLVSTWGEGVPHPAAPRAARPTRGPTTRRRMPIGARCPSE